MVDPTLTDACDFSHCHHGASLGLSVRRPRTLDQVRTLQIVWPNNSSDDTIDKSILYRNPIDPRSKHFMCICVFRISFLQQPREGKWYD